MIDATGNGRLFPSAGNVNKKLGKSRESLYSAMLKEPIKESKEEEECAACRQCDTCCEGCCCSFWTCTLMFILLIGGFLGGVVVGAIIQRNGYLNQFGVGLPEDFHDQYNNNQYDQNTLQSYIKIYVLAACFKYIY